MAAIDLIVGLGNPGPAYARTRHNAGFLWLEHIAAANNISFREQAKYHGQLARLTIAGQECWLLKPQTFMNRSGLSVAALANFYRIPAARILVAHDELDLPPGAVRLKQGGGHGGHNGLRDIIGEFGDAGFMRLRLGIGHPGVRELVTPYVLSVPAPTERDALEAAMQAATGVLPWIVSGDFARAMNHLHRQSWGTTD